MIKIIVIIFVISYYGNLKTYKSSSKLDLSHGQYQYFADLICPTNPFFLPSICICKTVFKNLKYHFAHSFLEFIIS